MGIFTCGLGLGKRLVAEWQVMGSEQSFWRVIHSTDLLEGPLTWASDFTFAIKQEWNDTFMSHA